MSFVPEGMEKAFVGDYMKFDLGPNKVGETKSYKIRILSEPISGYEYWVDADGQVVPRGQMAGKGGRPIRARSYDDFDMAERNGMKPFAAMVVWNYELEAIQILQATQRAIMNGLQALSESEGWGDVTTYDININKTKTGPEDMNVEYSVMPLKSDETPSEEILGAYEARTINLEALYEGEDPFEVSEDVDPEELPSDL